MSLRDPSPRTLLIAGAIILTSILLGGALVGAVSLTDISLPTTDSGNNTPNVEHTNLPEGYILPSGYDMDAADFDTAYSTHLYQLREIPVYEFERIDYARGTSATTETQLRFYENESVAGNQTWTADNGSSRSVAISSTDGIVYNVTDPETGEQVRQFADSTYGNGKDLIRQALTSETLSLENYDKTDEGKMYYYYKFSDGNKTGGLIVTEQGMVYRVFVTETVDGKTTRSEFTIHTNITSSDGGQPLHEDS